MAGRHVLSGVDLRIVPGERIALLGRSGDRQVDLAQHALRSHRGAGGADPAGGISGAAALLLPQRLHGPARSPHEPAQPARAGLARAARRATRSSRSSAASASPMRSGRRRHRCPAARRSGCRWPARSTTGAAVVLGDEPVSALDRRQGGEVLADDARRACDERARSARRDARLDACDADRRPARPDASLSTRRPPTLSEADLAPFYEGPG